MTLAFNEIKFKGKCIVDNIHLQNTKLTKVQMESINNTIEQPWTFNSIFIANFNDNLYAGNNTGWRLKRKLVSDTLFKTIKDFDFNELSYIDYQVKNRISYIYAIHSLAVGGEGLGVEGTANTSFYGWFLFDENKNFKLDMGFDGIQTGNIQIVEDVHVFDNYTQYPVFSFGERNYRQGDITAIPYRIVDSQYKIDVQVLNEIKAFIGNHKSKWLKNTAGEIFKVMTTNTNYKYQDKLQEQPYTISFNWTEIEDGEAI